jgi:hypothetical protein
MFQTTSHQPDQYCKLLLFGFHHRFHRIAKFLTVDPETTGGDKFGSWVLEYNTNDFN